MSVDPVENRITDIKTAVLCLRALIVKHRFQSDESLFEEDCGYSLGLLENRELQEENSRLKSQLAVADGMVDAMQEVIRISDRKTDIWDKAKESLTSYRAVKGDQND